jgi:two-component sensor histidine kinase/integral membrane sensor domain MASE1
MRRDVPSSRHDERKPRRITLGPRTREIARLVLVALTYLASAKLGLSLAFQAQQVTPVWPPAGIALGAYLWFGPRVWPGTFAGAFVANVTTQEPVVTAVAIAAGNTVAWLLVAQVARDVAKFDRSLERTQDVLVVVGCAALGSVLAATNGSIQLALAGLSPWSNLMSVWLVWWTGDALGALIVAPAIFTWTTRAPLSWRRRGELALLLVVGCGASYAALGQLVTPSRYIVFPFVLWAALRFRQRDVAMTVLGIGVISVWTVKRGYGPFRDIETLGMQLLFLDAFLAVVAITGFTVGAIVAERSRAQRALREANDRLGVLVEHRTAELTKANRELAKAQEMARVGSWEMLSGGQLEGSAELYRLLDVDPKQVGSYAEVLERVDPTDREHVLRLVTQMIADRAPVKFDFRMNDSGGRVRTLQARCEVKTDAEGRVSGVVGTLEDVTEARAAQCAIERSLQEKEVLLKEIHHRVKNNLQVVSSLLSLQAGSVADAHVTGLFQEANARIRSIALVHENLYQAENLASIDAGHYLNAVIMGLVQSYAAKATVTCNAEGIQLTTGSAIPCGLIVTELVSNALKHAFPDERRGHVVVSLTEDAAQHLLLEISDDGVGIPNGTDIKATKTMGLQVVHRLAAQLQAIVEVDRRAGTTFRLRFPKPS